VPYPTCGVAAGKRCVLGAGGPRNEPHTDRKLLSAEAMEKEKELNTGVKVPKNKEKSHAAFLALVARLQKEATKPYLTKSVRVKATKKQLASWNAS
jgi:hypothetical protein